MWYDFLLLRASSEDQVAPLRSLGVTLLDCCAEATW